MVRVHVAPRSTANGTLEVYGAPPLNVVSSVLTPTPVSDGGSRVSGSRPRPASTSTMRSAELGVLASRSGLGLASGLGLGLGLASGLGLGLRPEQLRLQPTSNGHEPLEQVIAEEMIQGGCKGGNGEVGGEVGGRDGGLAEGKTGTAGWLGGVCDGGIRVDRSIGTN